METPGIIAKDLKKDPSTPKAIGYSLMLWGITTPTGVRLEHNNNDYDDISNLLKVENLGRGSCQNRSTP